MSEIFNPLVSIVIPVYNGSNYMREAIDSALNQTYQNIEVLVINDGSSDEGKTREIALSYGDKIRYFEKENGGVSTALNLGIREMKGDYFSWLSHDDVYYPDRIEKQIKFLCENNKKEILLYSDYDLIDNNSKIINTFNVQHFEPFRICLLAIWPVNGCTTLIKKNILKATGLFKENAKYSQDYYLWFKLAKDYKFIHIKEKLIKSRIHEEQGTLKFNNEAYIEIEKMYKYFIDCLIHEEFINLLSNKKYIINGLRMKNQNKLIIYFLERLIGTKKLKISKKIIFKVEIIKWRIIFKIKKYIRPITKSSLSNSK